MIYFIPSILFSYYFGLRGGLIVAVISGFMHSVLEYVQYLVADRPLSPLQHHLEVGLINVTFSLCVGFLADKLKQKQVELENLNKELENQKQEILHMAYYDSLTGLPNRKLCLKYLDEALSSMNNPDDQIGIMFIDLDGFKAINDSYGHDAGDYLLKNISQRLKDCVDERGLMSRLAGDEFIAVLRAPSESEAKLLAERMLSVLEPPVIRKKQILKVSASIGIAFYRQDGVTIESVIKSADHAMYHAKENGKNNYCFFKDIKVG
jgi:diguanylate cyclase (GGDEF)-like protein